MKHISYKKIVPFVLGAGMLAGCATSRGAGLACYVVTAKANTTIVFTECAGYQTKRVMTFDSTEMEYYRSIGVGDTIGFAHPFSDTQLVVDARDSDIRLISRGDILRMYELQQQTELRDSLINKMNIKHK